MRFYCWVGNVGPLGVNGKGHKSTERRLQQRDVEMAERRGEMEFNIDMEEEEERLENVPTFSYLGRPLYQMDDEWPSVQKNIMRVGSVWGRLGTVL